MDDKKYDSRYDGETTDKILDNAKAIMEQTTAEDGETVQVYDTDGVPHKVSKTELLKKSTLALPALEDISSFVAVNAAGNAIGLMTKEQVASVLAELLDINKYLKQYGTLGRSEDLNDYSLGIYGYYAEAGLPVNSPSGAERGIILCLNSLDGQISQLVLEYSNSNVFHRASFNNGVNWGSWRQLS